MGTSYIITLSEATWGLMKSKGLDVGFTVAKVS